MADARDMAVWENHALEPAQVGTEPYEHSDIIDNLLKQTDGAQLVVDMGCGSGLWRKCFKKYGYLGIDQSPNMIDAAQNRDFSSVGRVTCFKRHNLREDLRELVGEVHPYAETLLVWFSAVLQHNRHEPDKREIMENVSNLLSPGSYLMFTENTFCPENPMLSGKPFEEGKNDGYSFTREQWKVYVSQFGFELVDNPVFNFYLFRRV